MQTEATTQHRWLQQMIGDWTMDGECVMGPDMPPEKSPATTADTITDQVPAGP